MSATVFDIDGSFEFAQRPRPVPGDLRIAWRMSVLLIGLYKSRGKRASYYKLHVLNDLFVNPIAAKKLNRIINNEIPPITWKTRIEPALNRATDFLVGEDLAKWTGSSSRATLVLTQDGIEAASRIDKNDELLPLEKSIAAEFSMKLTENFVRTLYFNRYQA